MDLIQRIAKSLQEDGVPYAIVGGYALALHGAPRGTVDIDLVIQHTEGVFMACEQALLKAGLIPRLPVSAREVFQFRQEYIQNRNLIAWSFFNPKNPIEIVDIILPFDLRQFTTVTRKYGLIRIPILSIDGLITMKKASDRPQDREDVKTLERLKHES